MSEWMIKTKRTILNQSIWIVLSDRPTRSKRRWEMWIHNVVVILFWIFILMYQYIVCVTFALSLHICIYITSDTHTHSWSSHVTVGFATVRDNECNTVRDNDTVRHRHCETTYYVWRLLGHFESRHTGVESHCFSWCALKASDRVMHNLSWYTYWHNRNWEHWVYSIVLMTR